MLLRRRRRHREEQIALYHSIAARDPLMQELLYELGNAPLLPPRPNLFTLWGPLCAPLDAEDVQHKRQQARNVFTERVRLSGGTVPDEAMLQQWWPGTVAMRQLVMQP